MSGKGGIIVGAGRGVRAVHDVTGSRPVRLTKAKRPSLPGSFEKNQGVKTLGQPTP